jgi:ADP-heptose:LPS heptosyltransferase
MSAVAADRLLVHLASGIGNIMLATPLLVALSRRFANIELRLDCDYPGAGGLFRHWSALRAVHDSGASELPGGAYHTIVPAIPPFAWPRYAGLYRHCPQAMSRPPDTLFYADEQAYYLDFARRLGCAVVPAPHSFVPVAPRRESDVSPRTLALAPGCKTGIMAAKRWPYFPRLAEQFDDVVIVGTADDLRCFDGTKMVFPPHVRSLVDRLSLPELAATLAACGVVVANDSGIGHLSAAVGVPTVLLFGPTPAEALGAFPQNVTVLRQALPCAPCWFADRLVACGGRIDCLEQMPPSRVAAALRRAGFRG